MRVGRNPLINREAPAHFPDVLLAVITHLPNSEGYHRERFAIVKNCIRSLIATSGGNSILVWDNGSSAEFANWLTTWLEPDYLTLSPNIGKEAARAAILNMVPPDTIVALCDDDMLFEVGWLDAHLQLLKGFPNVGAVSGFPNRFSFGWGIDATLQWARDNALLEQGRFIPEQYESDYARSIGVKPERLAEINKDKQDYRVTYNGMTAYTQASHCQFVCVAGKIAPLCDYSKGALGDEQPFDKAIDTAGLLRLTTTTRYVKHMGNVKGE